ncbi:MAG: ABC transporter permease [Caulobacter sp.]
MTMLRLLVAFAARRPASWIFHILVLACALGLVGAVHLASRAGEERLVRDLGAVDLVVGPPGGQLQLVLSSLLHLEPPVGVLPADALAALERDPLVAQITPVAVGDSVGMMRIVGTRADFGALYGARMAVGAWWSDPFEAVLGAEAARRLDLGIGARFVGEHGLGGGGHVHADRPYIVVGVLEPTGSVLDRLVLTDIASVWALHGQGDNGAGDHADHDHSREPEGAKAQVSAFLVRFRSPLATVTLPPRIEAMGGMASASPAREVQRLAGLIGGASQALGALGAGLAIVGLGGFVIALASAMLQRRSDFALLASLGARRRLIAGLVLSESAAMGLCAGLVATVLARLAAGLALGAAPGGALGSLPPPGPIDLGIVGAGLLLGLIGAIGPMVWALKLDPADALGRS